MNFRTSSHSSHAWSTNVLSSDKYFQLWAQFLIRMPHFYKTARLFKKDFSYAIRLFKQETRNVLEQGENISIPKYIPI